MIRAALAVVVGFAVWFIAATVGNLFIRALIAGYTTAEPSMDFTLSMLIARLADGFASTVLSGFVCSVIARGRRVAVYVFAIVLILFFLPIHYGLWSKFPVWYHTVFLVSLVPLVLVGASFHRSKGVGANANS